MENQTEIDELIPPPRWKTLLRQNSEKIGTLAEDVVLPKNQRSAQQPSVPEVILMQDVEAHDSSMSTMVIQRQQQKKKFPFFIVGISVIQILLSSSFYSRPFKVMLMNNVEQSELSYIFAYDPYRRHELWRLVTNMLVHNSLAHLSANVILQLILGIPLEIVHHWKSIAIIYLSSIVGGSLFVSVFSPRTYAAGASAGIYGLIFSHLSTTILNWNEMDRKCCRLFYLLAFIIFDIWSSSEIERNRGDLYISHASHLGGAVTGFLVSILVLKNFKAHPWEEKMQKICFAILSVLVVTIILINIFARELYLPTEWNLNYEKTYDIYFKKMIIESAKDSEIRKKCRTIVECKLMLDQYKFNGTISNVPFN